MAKKSKKVDRFEEFLESVPKDFNLLDELNTMIQNSDDDMSQYVGGNFPTDFGDVEEVFDGQQYGDDSSTYSTVWFFKKYNKYVATYYYHDSHNGDDYSDSEFVEVKPVQKTITVYEEV